MQLGRWLEVEQVGDVVGARVVGPAVHPFAVIDVKDVADFALSCPPWNGDQGAMLELEVSDVAVTTDVEVAELLVGLLAGQHLEPAHDRDPGFGCGDEEVG